MVGHEADDRYQCHFDPSIHCLAECRGKLKKRASLSQCGHFALEGKPRANDGGTENKAAAEASAASGLHDEGASSEVLMARQTSSAPCKVLLVGVVHGKPTQRDNGPEVVDDRS
jgi:hypothetical protein